MEGGEQKATRGASLAAQAQQSTTHLVNVPRTEDFTHSTLVQLGFPSLAVRLLALAGRHGASALAVSCSSGGGGSLHRAQATEQQTRRDTSETFTMAPLGGAMRAPPGMPLTSLMGPRLSTSNRLYVSRASLRKSQNRAMPPVNCSCRTGCPTACRSSPPGHLRAPYYIATTSP